MEQSDLERILLDYNTLHISPPLSDDVVLDRARRYSRVDLDDSATADWLEPGVVKDALPPVPSFDIRILPKVLQAAVADASELMQCPPEFLAVPYMVGAAAALGLRISVAPKAVDTSWIVPAVLWGLLVGTPGAKKSPAISRAMEPLRNIESKLAATHNLSRLQYEADLLVYEAQYAQAVKAAKSGGAALAAPVRPEEPKPERLVVNDSSYQALGEVLRWSPRGVVVSMDEIAGLLQSLDAQNQESARAFYLTAWNGDEAYRFDRIQRGSFMVDPLAMSLIGGIQPQRLMEYTRSAVLGGKGDDGLMQRMQLAVWPDVSDRVQIVDRAPDFHAQQAVVDAIEKLRDLDPVGVEATVSLDGKSSYLQFAPDAQKIFNKAWLRLERRARSESAAPVLASHFAKYPRMIAVLALITHLLDDGVGPITLKATLQALGWAAVLEKHANRIYSQAGSQNIAAAYALSQALLSNKLDEGFTARKVIRKKWRDLATSDQVYAAIDHLVEQGWLKAEIRKSVTGGRSSTTYLINPRIDRRSCVSNVSTPEWC